jgi:tetratricopeptide (TPR) repeat protein
VVLHSGRFLLVALFLLSSGVRLAYLTDQTETPFFCHPRLDGLFHDIWAQSIAAGNVTGDDVFFRAPLYAYQLAAVYCLFGHDFVAARVVQYLLGAGSTLLLFLIGRRIFGTATAAIAAVVFAVYPAMIYFEGELLLEGTAVFLSLLWLYSLQRTAEAPHHPIRWLGTGILLGILALCRPLLLPAGLVASAYLWLVNQRAGLQNFRSSLSAIAIIVGCLLVVLPVTIRNYLVGGDAVFIASQGGLNFFIGNNPRADGFSSSIPGRGDTFWEGGFVSNIAEKELGFPPSPSEESTFWYRKGLAFAVSEPIDFIRLFVRKMYLFWNHVEIPNNQSYYFARQYSELLEKNPLGFGLVAPLGVLGMALGWKHQRGKLLVIFVVCCCIVTAAFFVCDRFRLPVVPVLCLFGTYAVVWCVERVHAHDLRSLLPATAWALGAAIVINSNLIPIGERNFSREYLALGIVQVEQGNEEAALAYFNKSDSMYSSLPGLNIHRAAALWRLGRKEEAAKRLHEESRTYPRSFGAALNLSIIHRDRGNLDSAIYYGRKSVTLNPVATVGYTTLAQALLLSDDVNAADSILGIGMARCREVDEIEYLRAEARYRSGNLEGAEQLFRSIINRPDVPDQPRYEPELSFVRFGGGGHTKREIVGKALYGLGHVYVQRGVLDSTAVFFSEASSLLPGDAEIWGDLGVCLLRLGKPAEAEVALKKAITIDPTSHLSLFNLAVAQGNQRKLREAEETLRGVLNLKPDFAPAKEKLDMLAQMK